MFNTLSFIGEKLNDADVVWGVGASLLLNKFGLIDKPNDIDIFISIDDIEKADNILRSIGEKKKWEKTTTYATKYFYEYVINGVDIDVMAGFAINHNEGTFKYVFDNNSISEYKVINGVNIPFTSLEDWYVIYQLIPNREAKVKMIEKYILSNGIKKPLLSERGLEGCLPVEVRAKVYEIIDYLHKTDCLEKAYEIGNEGLRCLGGNYVTVKEAKCKWLEKFAANISEEDKEEHITSSGNYLWHIFSWNYVEAIAGDRARAELEKLRGKKMYGFNEFDSDEEIIKEYDEIALEFIENELDEDIYLFDESFKWTYVKTHESMCGPYFFYV